MTDTEKARQILKISNSLLALQMSKLIEQKEQVATLDKSKDYYNVLVNCQAEYEAVELSIKALQQMADREKGCRTCGNGRHGKITKVSYRIDYSNGEIMTGSEMKICLNCGRKLVD